ncbi:hypothetical protein RA11412_2143 [Rothia aeria]|uniref:Uncharacterized protein n=1 Tax=Rothia aeria TaxID=172042 RepID=A0A2Z5R192_9MICC|nr:hypothetical protein RA11412_2143 [Rothia aeria]
MHLLNEGVPSPTTSRMRALSSAALMAWSMSVLMRGLLTRGAGVGRGVFGGTGRSMIDGFMV